VQKIARCLAREEEPTVQDPNEREALDELLPGREVQEGRVVYPDYKGYHVVWGEKGNILVAPFQEPEVLESETGGKYVTIALLEAAELCLQYACRQMIDSDDTSRDLGECQAPACNALFVQTPNAPLKQGCCKACIARAHRHRQGTTKKPRPPRSKPTDSPFWTSPPA